MAITTKVKGVWNLDQVYNKEVGLIWTPSSQLQTWGQNSKGNLGISDTADRSSPVQLPGLTDTVSWNLDTMGATIDTSYAIKTDGSLWTWGGSGNGSALGQNQPNNTEISSPKQVGTDTTWNYIQSAGGAALIASKTNGTLWSWGYNNRGQLGQNSQDHPGGDNRSSPAQIGTNTDWDKPVMGNAIGRSACWARKTDGTLWSWGYNNNYGQLGLNTKNDQRSSPAQVVGTTWPTDPAQYASGNAQVFVIKDDGTLWGWGCNYASRLGMNTQTHYSSPMQLNTDTNWNTISAYESAVATKTDGTLWSWSYNDYGQLGQNNKTNYSSPRQIGTDTTWVWAKANTRSIIAKKTDGTLWSWGENTEGQLGLNDRTDYSSPMQIGTDTGWQDTNFACANTSGELATIDVIVPPVNQT